MFPLLVSLVALTTAQPGAASAPLNLKYLGAAGADGWAVRFEFTRGGGEAPVACTFRGVTTAGNQVLTLVAAYRADRELHGASVSVRRGKEEKAVLVTVNQGRARVTRPGQKPQEFEAPAGVIVTSAPDWSDIVLLCQRYDRAKGGKQAFAALWIHPEQPALFLKLAIERQGHVAIRDGKLKLTRFLIHLRNQSAYHAWAADDGTLVRLAPAAATGARAGLFLSGYENDPAWKK